MPRPDGRAPDQLRPTRIEPDYLDFAEGSALITMGQTRVLCAATVQNGVPPFLRDQGRGWLTAEYSMLPRATPTRTPREVQAGRPGGRTQEIQRLIGRALRAGLDFAALGERTVIVDCDVLQADGGTRTAAITGGWVATVLALEQLRRSGALTTLPVRLGIAAVSCGVVDGVPVLDLPYVEDARAEVDVNVVMTDDGRLVEVQGTAEGQPFARATLTALLDLAAGGVDQLFAEQRRALAAARTPVRWP
jgi:ribonuclease PH